MKGLEIAEQYYRAVGVPMIEEKFKIERDRIAAGLVGEGSECFGFDDEISRDHDWGPSFCLWLLRADFDEIGQALQHEYEMLPGEFAGFGPRNVSSLGSGRVGVFEIGTFYRRFIAREQAPEKLFEWRSLPEEYLAVCTNGKVFTDPHGEFSRIRNELLAFYPEDIRLKKIAARSMSAAQAGQYNFWRSVRRAEYVAAQYAETKFIADVISIIFLLNRSYKPFYKWMHRALKDLPLLGAQAYEIIKLMVGIHEYEHGRAVYEKKNNLIEEISRIIIDEFHHQGLSDAASNFLLDHGPQIQQRIHDPQLKAMNVWIE